jgi:hypothetical protein
MGKKKASNDEPVHILACTAILVLLVGLVPPAYGQSTPSPPPPSSTVNITVNATALAELNAAVNDALMIYVWVGVAVVSVPILIAVICCCTGCALCASAGKSATSSTTYVSVPNPQFQQNPQSLASTTPNNTHEESVPSAPPWNSVVQGNERDLEPTSRFVAINMPSLGASMEQFMSAAARTCSKGRRYHV